MAAGLAIGLGLAPAATRALDAVVFGVSTTDPVAYLASAGVLALATAAACLVPANRASRSDPMTVLRGD